jgi:hypothetical protein
MPQGFQFMAVAPVLQLLIFSAARAGQDKNESWVLVSFILTNRHSKKFFLVPDA